MFKSREFQVGSYQVGTHTYGANKAYLGMCQDDWLVTGPLAHTCYIHGYMGVSQN